MRQILRVAIIGARDCLCVTASVWRGDGAADRKEGLRYARIVARRLQNAVAVARLIGGAASCSEPFRGALVGIALVAPGVAALAAAPDLLPVPGVTIYPGDAIKDELLVDREFAAAFVARGGFVSSRLMLVGKIARRTLLPGAPIPLNAVALPKIVANGARVRMVFEEGVLTIAAYGAALQEGSAGDVISLRNLDTGLTVSGTIQADGSVRLSGG